MSAARAWSLAGVVLLLVQGCATGPLQENPVFLASSRPANIENPVFLPQGPPAYNQIYSKVLGVVTDYFPDIAYAHRYDGIIESYPRIAPGLAEPWKPGSPDLYQRTLASLQTIRHRAVVSVAVADGGGYFVDVKVFKELEDLDRPSRSTAGAASFRSLNTVERQFEVVDATSFQPAWIPVGRDSHLEQVILERIAHIDLRDCPTLPIPGTPAEPAR